MTEHASTSSPSEHRAIASRIIGNIVQAGPPKVSPDGRLVAFTVARVDEAKNKTFSQIWVAAADGSAPPRPLTAGEHDGEPAWSPDGRSLAFISRRGDKKNETTMHVLPVDGPGEVRTIATLKDSTGGLEYSPDGRWIGFIARTPDERYDAEDVSWQSPRKVERFFSRLNGENWIFDRPAHVYVVPADGSKPPRNLTPGPFQHDGISWTPDGSAIVTSAQRHDTWDLDFAQDLYLVPVTTSGDDGAGIVGLTKQTGMYFSPSVSADGATVAFIGYDDPASDPQNARIGVVPLSGGDHRWLSLGLDRTFQTTAGTAAPRWIDGATLLGTAEDRGETHLFRVTTGGTVPEKLTSVAVTVKAFDARNATVALTVGAVDEVADIFVLDAGGDLRRLTDFADRYREAVSPLGWERFAVPTTDGTNEIDAWIMRPAAFDPAQTYPTILNVHGGPHTQYGESFFEEAQFQAAAGFVVLMSNPRGGSGREESWGQSIMGPKHPHHPGSGWGSVDVDDVLAVVDHTVATFAFVDPERIGMQGGSYGGYMATWLAGTTGTKFKAICSERAVNNMFTEEYTSDIGTVFRVEHGTVHIDDPDEYARMSPIRFVRDIEVPVLIIHSEDDLRCPISQAEELFVAMRLLRKDVTFYRFPGESHELSRSGSPVHRAQRAEIILDFVARHHG
jgi:dipeptidyl aminopeptidase/acylaminoacyl peptidase